MIEERNWRVMRQIHSRRIPWRISLLLVASSLHALVPLPASSSAEQWILIEFRANGDDLHSVEIDYSVGLEADGSGPLVIGFGHGGFPVQHRSFRVLSSAGGSEGITTTSDLGGAALTLTEGKRVFGGVSGSLLLHLEAGQSEYALVFVGNGTISGYAVERSDPSGGELRIETGSGTGVIYGANPSDRGYGAAVGRTWAGSGTHAVDVSAGLVGDIDRNGCDACWVDWRDPTGRSSTLTQVKMPAFTGSAIGPTNFAGPAGRWTWHWMGLNGPDESDVIASSVMARPVVAAYAPIGPAWPAFEDCDCR